MDNFIVDVILPEGVNDSNLKTIIINKFNDYLNEVQELLGKRDNKYNQFQIFFDLQDKPQLYFEDLTISIHLTINSISDNFNNYYRWEYQLAHEVVHCLNPIKIENGTVLEEGIATSYSEKRVNGSWTANGDFKYYNAKNLFEKLPIEHRFKIIFEIREENNLKSISEINENDLFLKIQTLGLNLEDSDISKLCSKFKEAII